MRTGYPFLATLATIACAGAADAGDAASRRLVELCQTTTNMPAAVCDCVGQKAATDLSPEARAFLVASMDKREEEAATLRGKLSLEETMKAGMFFATAPASCASASVGAEK
jgi:hypothetical protein